MSTSLARIENNRRNAQLSTGPRTPRGKSASRRNAIRHGIHSCLPVLEPGESRDLWDRFAAALATELQPAGPTESLLVAQIAKLQWRLLRCADARRTLAEQQWREATLHAPQTDWWKHRRATEEILPASPDRARRNLSENRRCRKLLARVMAAPAPADDPQLDKPIKGQTAVDLINWAAGHLGVDDELTKSLDEWNWFPGLGDFEVADEQDAALHDWTPARVRKGLTEIAGWAKLTYEQLIETLPAAMTRAWNLMRRGARRAAGELRAFRRFAAARPTAESQQLDRDEATLERRLVQAMDQLQRLQARRRLEEAPKPSQSGADVVPNGPVSRKTPEKPAQVGFVSSEPLPAGYNEANAKCP